MRSWPGRAEEARDGAQRAQASAATGRAAGRHVRQGRCRATSATTPRWRPCSATSGTDHPDAIVDAMCTGPDTVSGQVRHRGHPAVLAPASISSVYPGSPATALKVLGKGIDAFRTAAWVRRHDVVIVPGMGVLEASLPHACRGGSRMRCSCSARPAGSSGRRSRWSAWVQAPSTSR